MTGRDVTATTRPDGGLVGRHWFSHMVTTGLEHLVLDTTAELVGVPDAALFSPCRQYRYGLSRQWDASRPPAIWIMLNPSTADAFKLDPTIIRCRQFARDWGCGGLVVVNAFAHRSPVPTALRTVDDPVGPDNDRVIISVLCAGNTGPVIVAWGCDETLRRSGRGDRIVSLLHTGGIEPQCLGKTKDGFPRHPLYVRGDTAPTPYPDADAYATAANRAGALDG